MHLLTPEVTGLMKGLLAVSMRHHVLGMVHIVVNAGGLLTGLFTPACSSLSSVYSVPFPAGGVCLVRP